MSHLRYFILARSFGLACFIILAAGCARLAASPSDFQLTLTPGKAKYQPGEPVAVNVTLANQGAGQASVPMLDHASVVFTIQPQRAASPNDLRFVQPVFSSKEQAGAAKTLEPGGALARTFYFTNLSFERGAHVLGAVYTLAADAPGRPGRKVYAKAVGFTVEGEKVFAHRYLNGLVSREDAIAIAAAKAGIKPEASETLLITDEAGFQKWWVNLTAGGTVRAWFVDPYFATVWKEARPFTATDKGTDTQPPKDSQLLQRVKEQGIEKRSQK